MEAVTGVKEVCEKPCSRIGCENLAAARGLSFFLLHLVMSKRPATAKQQMQQQEETNSDSDSDSDEKPVKQPTAKQPKANAAKIARPQGATPKDPVSNVALTWNGDIGQWEHVVEGEVVYARQPKSSTNAAPTPTKTAAAPAADAAVIVPAKVEEAAAELDDAGDDEFVTKLKKQQRKIRKKADKEIAAIEQLIADHAEEQQLKTRLAALTAAKVKYGGSSSTGVE